VKPGAASAILAAFCALAAPLSAADPHIHPLAVKVERNQVSVDFGLNGALESGLQARLESGLSTAIDYDIGLLDRNRYWFDRQLDSHRLRVEAACDAVRRECVVKDFWDGRPSGVAASRSLAEASRMLVARAGLAAFRVKRDWPHKHLYVRMRASFDAGKFVALKPVEVSTDWKKSKTFKIHDADLR
jgi:Domain of unknown function (DUF4390)